MPWHSQAVIRTREEAWESFGIIQSQDTQGVTILKYEESNGLRTELVPKFVVYSNNSSYTPS